MELSISNITVTNPHFASHILIFPILYIDINNFLLLQVFAIFASRKFKTNFNYYQIEMTIWTLNFIFQR